MVSDAEAHAEEDKKFRKLVDARNQADAMIDATEKSVAELGDKVEADEKSKIEAAVAALKEAIEKDELEPIEEKTRELAELSGSLAQRVYAEKSGERARADSRRVRRARATMWLMQNSKK